MDAYLVSGNYVACQIGRCRMAVGHIGPHLPQKE